MTKHSTRQPGSQPSDPGPNFGLAFGGFWVLFLFFPIFAAITGELPDWQKVVSVALTAVFAIGYFWTLVHVTRGDLQSRTGTPGLVGLGVLILLWIGQIPLLGMGAAGFAPFVISLSLFGLTMVAGWVFAAVVNAVVALAIVLTGNLAEWGTFLIITVVVSAVSGVSRVMASRSIQYEEMREEMALVSERERVARDVHDVLGHTLTIISLKAELAERMLDVDPSRTRAEIREIHGLSREAISEVRQTVGGLKIRQLGAELDAARVTLADAGIAADVPAEAAAVDPRHRLVFAWVLREAVTNIVRHAQASHVTVTLAPAQITVTDDGIGVGGRPEGNGLRGMRERVAEAGGTLHVTPGADGRGTTLEATL